MSVKQNEKQNEKEDEKFYDKITLNAEEETAFLKNLEKEENNIDIEEEELETDTDTIPRPIIYFLIYSHGGYKDPLDLFTLKSNIPIKYINKITIARFGSLVFSSTDYYPKNKKKIQKYFLENIDKPSKELENAIRKNYYTTFYNYPRILSLVYMNYSGKNKNLIHQSINKMITNKNDHITSNVWTKNNNVPMINKIYSLNGNNPESEKNSNIIVMYQEGGTLNIGDTLLNGIKSTMTTLELLEKAMNNGYQSVVFVDFSCDAIKGCDPTIAKNRVKIDQIVGLLKNDKIIRGGSSISKKTKRRKGYIQTRKIKKRYYR